MARTQPLLADILVLAMAGSLLQHVIAVAPPVCKDPWRNAGFQLMVQFCRFFASATSDKASLTVILPLLTNAIRDKRSCSLTWMWASIINILSFSRNTAGMEVIIRVALE